MNEKAYKNEYVQLKRSVMYMPVYFSVFINIYKLCHGVNLSMCTDMYVGARIDYNKMAKQAFVVSNLKILNRLEQWISR